MAGRWAVEWLRSPCSAASSSFVRVRDMHKYMMQTPQIKADATVSNARYSIVNEVIVSIIILAPLGCGLHAKQEDLFKNQNLFNDFQRLTAAPRKQMVRYRGMRRGSAAFSSDSTPADHRWERRLEAQRITAAHWRRLLRPARSRRHGVVRLRWLLETFAISLPTSAS